MILAYIRSGVLQAVDVVRKNPKSVTVKFAGEPRRNPLRVPNDDPYMRLFVTVDEALDYVGHPELKGE